MTRSPSLATFWRLQPDIVCAVPGTSTRFFNSERLIEVLSIVKGRVAELFCMGGRMIHMANDYQCEAFFGDVSTVTSIELEEQEVRAQFVTHRVTFDYANLADFVRSPGDYNPQAAWQCIPGGNSPRLHVEHENRRF